MSQIPNLDNAPINLTSIRDQSQKELLNILRNVRGRKCVVIDQTLSGPLSLLIQTTLLKENGAELRHLSSEPIQTDCSKIVFLVRCHPSLMEFILSNIQYDISKGLKKDYFIYFVPRRTVACEKVLEKDGIHNMITIGEFPLYLVPLDDDVLSFELDFAYRDVHVDGDTSSLWHIAKALHKLELSFGVIRNFLAKGSASVKVVEILESMQAEDPVDSEDVGIPEINTIILLDRDVDMFTPMCFQLTYEGIIDEILRINSGSVELDASIMGTPQDGKKVKVPLNSSDRLYKEVRDLQFGVVMQVLRERATSMKQDYADISSTQTVSELKDFVKKLNSLPEISRHINLAQHLCAFTSKPSFNGRLDIEQTILEGEAYEICFEHVEEMIHKQEPIISVLRLLVLFSITNAGLPKKNFDYLRRELLHSYGFEHMPTLYNLEKAGLLKKQELKSNWPIITRALKLIADDSSSTNPNDIAHLYSGYAPLSIRLVQHAIRSGWRSIEEVLKLLPGPMKRGGDSTTSDMRNVHANLGRPSDGRRSVALVVFIGGVTSGELSALRFLSSQEGMGHDFIVATTKVVNGNTLLETLLDTTVRN
ncbi:putative Vacuolar protein sorting [Zostera marina]|uniref:Putative Vacuolar protein sorting n=1 Tax=Zostera marina TaxID=29655 RepID=A0A0K9P7I6_ZOSMR|nr:putative Vacuolar protein sorting [Zostera marina]